MDTFEQALNFTLKWEGGYVDHPNDPGGATNKGITIGTAKAHGVDVDGDGDTDKDDMRNLPLDIAMQIYKADYWNASRCADYNWDFAIALFDSAVNCGVSRSTKWVNESQGDVNRLINLRVIHYIALSKQDRFKPFYKGWMNRVNDLKKYLEILRNERGSQEVP